MKNIEKTAPIEVQQSIAVKKAIAKENDPTLQDGCEDLNSISMVELADDAGIDIQELIGKEKPDTEDDDFILMTRLKSLKQ